MRRRRDRAVGALLSLCFGICWVSAQKASVSLSCGSSRLVLRVAVDLFGNGVLVRPEELVLGRKCPVTQQHPDHFLFDYLLQDCSAVRQFLQNSIHYKNQLHYRPIHTGGIQRANAISVPVSCSYPRTGNTSSLGVQPTWDPFRSTYYGRGQLDFALQLFDSTWSAPQQNVHYFFGDLLNIQASVAALHHMPLKIYVDECVARPSMDSTLKYEVVTDHGCLVDGVQGRSRFVSPRGDRFLRFQLDAFTFAGVPDTQIFLLCQLKVVKADTAMTQPQLNKACSYHSAHAAFYSEEPGEDCSCCASATGCRATGSRRRRQLAQKDSPWEANISLGPISIMQAETGFVTLESSQEQAVMVHMLAVNGVHAAHKSSESSLDGKMLALPLLAMLAFILGFIVCRHATHGGHQQLSTVSEDILDQFAMHGIQ
ncbi:zona pellucida sperm-binding protein 3-like [Rhinatrema bivittatum]|uniref:zona pellucida sperm-binding protein 3-like n=1 Tax=Rhinatrema bivittatum TaxID=194408 RepID=UPI00112A1346|nr:zona pellucida sperm-binding protein 3-like [Rhinatrema bivittatum]